MKQNTNVAGQAYAEDIIQEAQDVEDLQTCFSLLEKEFLDKVLRINTDKFEFICYYPNEVLWIYKVVLFWQRHPRDT